MAAPPPSKPDRRFSRIRLSSRWVLTREGTALRLVPKCAVQTFGTSQAICTRLIPPPASPCGHSLWFSFPSFCPSHFHLPAFPSLHGRYPLPSYYGRSDSRQPGGWTLGPSLPPALAGLPGCLVGTSGHSVSNHQRVVRGLPGCPTGRLLASRPLYSFVFRSQTRPAEIRLKRKAGRTSQVGGAETAAARLSSLNQSQRVPGHSAFELRQVAVQRRTCCGWSGRHSRAPGQDERCARGRTPGGSVHDLWNGHAGAPRNGSGRTFPPTNGSDSSQ
jgi:hypothetical protein